MNSPCTNLAKQWRFFHHSPGFLIATKQAWNTRPLSPNAEGCLVWTSGFSRQDLECLELQTNELARNALQAGMLQCEVSRNKIEVLGSCSLMLTLVLYTHGLSGDVMRTASRWFCYLLCVRHYQIYLDSFNISLITFIFIFP